MEGKEEQHLFVMIQVNKKGSFLQAICWVGVGGHKVMENISCICGLSRLLTRVVSNNTKLRSFLYIKYG